MQMPEVQALEAMLAEAGTIFAVEPEGSRVTLDVRSVASGVVRARCPAGRVPYGLLLTVRLPSLQGVWFVQLLAGDPVAHDDESDLLELRVGDAVLVPSERALHRDPFEGPVKVMFGLNRVSAGRTLDISPTGIRLLTTMRAAPGAELDLHIGGHDEQVRMRVRVLRCVRSADGEFEIGAEVVALPPADWIRLERLLG